MKRGVLFLMVMAVALAGMAQDWTKIIVGPDKPSKTELQYLKGVTGPVQTQLQNKPDLDDGFNIKDSVYLKQQVDNLANTSKLLRRLGTSIITSPAFKSWSLTGNQQPSQSTMSLVMLEPILKDTTATGIKVPVQTPGSFTNNANFSGAGLLEVKFNGTYELVAISANLPDQWKVTAGTSAVFPFTAPYAMKKDKLYIGFFVVNYVTSGTSPILYAFNGMPSSIFSAITGSPQARPCSYRLGVTSISATYNITDFTAGSTTFALFVY